MATNVEVTKSGSENNLSVIRKFTKRVQGSGVLNRLRSIRYSKRNVSEFVKKKSTLKRLTKKAHIEHQIKMGKMVSRSR